jgi:hypothetical protein
VCNSVSYLNQTPGFWSGFLLGVAPTPDTMMTCVLKRLDSVFKVMIILGSNFSTIGVNYVSWKNLHFDD